MQGETWQDLGTPGTQALGCEEVEQAIARLEQMWEDTQAHSQNDRVLSTQECCDCCHRQAS
jgi:hypothetical protein